MKIPKLCENHERLLVTASRSGIEEKYLKLKFVGPCFHTISPVLTRELVPLPAAREIPPYSLYIGSTYITKIPIANDKNTTKYTALHSEHTNPTHDASHLQMQNRGASRDGSCPVQALYNTYLYHAGLYNSTYFFCTAPTNLPCMS